MKPIVLKTNKDYEKALNHLTSLMEQPEIEDVNEEIELFTTLISLYEEEHFPVARPTPLIFW